MTDTQQERSERNIVGEVGEVLDDMRTHLDDVLKMNHEFAPGVEVILRALGLQATALAWVLRMSHKIEAMEEYVQPRNGCSLCGRPYSEVQSTNYEKSGGHGRTAAVLRAVEDVKEGESVYVDAASGRVSRATDEPVGVRKNVKDEGERATIRPQDGMKDNKPAGGAGEKCQGRNWTEDDHQESRAICAALPERKDLPWHVVYRVMPDGHCHAMVQERGGAEFRIADCGESNAAVRYGLDKQNYMRAQFIAHAQRALPAALDEIERLNEVCASYEWVAESNDKTASDNAVAAAIGERPQEMSGDEQTAKPGPQTLTDIRAKPSTTSETRRWLVWRGGHFEVYAGYDHARVCAGPDGSFAHGGAGYLGRVRIECVRQLLPPRFHGQTSFSPRELPTQVEWGDSPHMRRHLVWDAGRFEVYSAESGTIGIVKAAVCIDCVRLLLPDKYHEAPVSNVQVLPTRVNAEGDESG